jgi:hypothetical protein
MIEDCEPAAPEMPVAFDQDGRPIAIAEPAIYDVRQREPDDFERKVYEAKHDSFEQRLVLLIAWLAGDGSVFVCGLKAKLLRHVCGRSGCRTDAELANELGVSGARISQIRAELNRLLPGIGRWNHR